MKRPNRWNSNGGQSSAILKFQIFLPAATYPVYAHNKFSGTYIDLYKHCPNAVKADRVAVS